MRNAQYRVPLCLLLLLLASAAWAEVRTEPRSGPSATSASQPDAARLYLRWVADLASKDMAGRETGTRGGDLARDWVTARFKAAGLTPAFGDSYLQELSFRYRTRVAAPATQPAGKGVAPATQPASRWVNRQAVGHNVVGLLPGRGKLAGEAIVIGAHYDHIGHSGRKNSDGNPIHYPGADDNASGTAGLVMLAHWLAARESSLGDGDRRTLIFAAFAGEERGLHGSAWLATHLPAPPAGASTQPDAALKVVAMLNMDMIGRLRNNRLYVQGVESGDRWRQVMATAAKDCRLDLRMSGGGYGPSDHASFYARGVPVLFFITGGHVDVHQTTDTPDKINADGAVEVCRLVGAVAGQLRTDPAQVAYVKTTRPTAMPPGPGQAYLGVMPDQLESTDGCLLADVMDGSPADKAGLRPDDMVVSWNGRKIANARDLLAAVAGQKTGDTVKLQVRRAGKMMDLSVTLGER